MSGRVLLGRNLRIALLACGAVFAVLCALALPALAQAVPEYRPGGAAVSGQGA